jgi:hypothetical protein
MTRLDFADESLQDHPLDIAETVIASNGWRFARNRDDEIAAEVRGQWCDFSLHFAYVPEASAVHFTCAFDMRVPDHRKRQVNDLLAILNDRMWLGHFGVWENEGLPMFRYTMLLRGAPEGMTAGQLEDLLEVAVAECERFYPAFQFVIWGGKDPAEAVAAAILDPAGEA